VYLNGSSTVEFVEGVFNGISSLSTSGAIFSDSSSTTPRTVVVKINATVYQGVFIFALPLYNI
jgi:hypothetical protein